MTVGITNNRTLNTGPGTRITRGSGNLILTLLRLAGLPLRHVNINELSTFTRCNTTGLKHVSYTGNVRLNIRNVIGRNGPIISLTQRTLRLTTLTLSRLLLLDRLPLRRIRVTHDSGLTGLHRQRIRGTRITSNIRNKRLPKSMMTMPAH